jgi:hypothetical protein
MVFGEASIVTRSRFKLLGVNHADSSAWKSASIADNAPTRDVAEAEAEPGAEAREEILAFSARMHATRSARMLTRKRIPVPLGKWVRIV